MAGTIRKLTLPVLIALGLCVMSFSGPLVPAAWDLFNLSATAAPADKTGVAALRQAQKLLKRGKAKKAAGLLNTAISSGSLTGVNMASALYYRGVALRKMGKPAQAIADFTNALWLKNGLNPNMRAAAESGRTAAYREAGLQSAGGQAAARKQNVATVRRPTRQPVARPGAQPAPPSGNWQTQTRGRVAVPTVPPAAPVQAVKPKSSSNGISGFFNNLFGGGNKKTSAASKPVPTRVQAPPQTSPGAGRLTQVSGWSSNTQVKPRNGAATTSRQTARPTPSRVNRSPGRQTRRAVGPVRQRVAARQPTTRQRPQRPVASRQRAPQTGRSSVGAVRVVPKRRVSYGMVLSPVRSLKVANANAVTVKQRFAQVLGQRQPVVEQMSFGGSIFYQVRIGPFANAAPPGSVCAKLKAAGIDCVLAKY